MDRIPRPPGAPDRKPGGRKLRVLGKEPLAAVLDVAAARAIERVLPGTTIQDVDAIRDVLRREFTKLVKDSTRAVRGVSKSEFLLELERERDKILASKRAAEQELEELQERTSFLREMMAGDLSCDDAETARRDARLEKLLDARFREVLRHSDLGPASSRTLREALVASASSAARQEWERALETRRKSAQEQIERYERRIAKLTGSLQQTESALVQLAELKEGDPSGLASIHRTVQGLEAGQDYFELKQQHLRLIYRANLEFQKSS